MPVGFKVVKLSLRSDQQRLEGFSRLVVPQPVWDYTTARVLTMTYVRGVRVTDAAGRVRFDGTKLADQLFTAYLQQMLLDGVFHADPHPGNVVVTPKGRLGLLDVGMVGRLSPTLRRANANQSSTLTTNSVPRTPRIAVGVRSVIASGDCFAMRPEMTESDPLRSDASNWP